MGQRFSGAGRRAQGPALLKALRSGDSAVVHEVLASCPGAAGYCTIEGLSCVHVAAATRRADLLEALLLALRQAQPPGPSKHKAFRRSFATSINQKNVHGQTPLMLACRSGGADCVRLLLEAGADPTLFDSLQQRTCLHYAALHGWAEAVEALLEDESVVRAADGRLQPLREALIADSQGHHRYIDGREGCGLAPLHLAATHGHLAAVKALLKWGASVAVRCNTSYGYGSSGMPWTPHSTPLHYAAASGHCRVAYALLRAAAERQQSDPHAHDVRLLLDFRGRRAYDIAAAAGHRSLLVALNPRVPLAALLQQAAAAPAVPSLASLAAAALRRQLVHRLGELQQACSAAAASEAAAAPGSKRGRGSRGGSREGSSHGGAAYAAVRGLSTAVLARLSGGCTGGRVSAACDPPSPHAFRHASLAGGRPRHARHASDSGVGGSLRSFAYLPASSGGAGAGGSLRGGSLLAAHLASPQLLPQPSGDPQLPRQFSGGAGAALLPQLSGGGGGAPFPAPPRALLDPEAAASVAGCTSVTSAAGCPVCLDSPLEVCITPCRHGLCMECAQHLSGVEEGAAAGGGTPPLCPLCRGIMGGFALV